MMLIENKIKKYLSSISEIKLDSDVITLIINQDSLLTTMKTLKENEELNFQQLTDLCAVDYSQFKNRMMIYYSMLVYTITFY